jgi:exopolyphosphatase/guanosine-5'-triphosphate,3'-diphosphate pyrophosphatase
MKKYAAIDIGSNAIRLLIVSVFSNNSLKQYRKINLVRLPIRLGGDVFIDNKISKNKTNQLISALKSFKILMSINKVHKYKICATSAMREASNTKKIIKEVYDTLKLNINVITGKEEASIIANVFVKNYNHYNNLLYVDVGGGSTELTVINDGNIITSKSFKIGTVRMLNSVINKNIWVEYKNWIKANIKDCNNISTIASGGNANKILKLSGKKIAEPISISLFEDIYKELRKHSFEERVSILNLNPDRADVIIPAAEIYLRSMKYSNSKQVIIPRIGLADGIIRKIDSNKYYGDILSK